MRFYIINHQNKGLVLKNALLKEGWILDRHRPDIALVDRDYTILNQSPRRGIESLHTKLVAYPHSALPPWWYDGMTPACVSCVLVTGEAHVEAMRIIMPSMRTETIGWYYCPTAPFKRKPIKRLLFAPAHPSGGVLRPEALAMNQQIHQELIGLAKHVTVRHLFPLKMNGLERNPNIHYKAGLPDNSYKDIDNADLVIAEGTFMYLAVARGKPVIGYGQHLPPRPNKNPQEPKHFDQWGRLIAYPINYGAEKLEILMQKAVEEEPVEWKRRNLGVPFNPKRFSQLMKGLANELPN